MGLLRGTLRLRQRRTELEKREWIAPPGFEDAPLRSRSECGETSAEQVGGSLVLERAQLQGGEAGLGEDSFLSRARCSKKADLTTSKTTRDEAENHGTGAIDPLEVVDDNQHGNVSGSVTKHGECGRRDDEPFGYWSFVQTQGHVQRISLEGAELGKRLLERIENLVEGRESHVGFELCAGRRKNPGAALRSRVRRNAKKGALADPWLAKEYECFVTARQAIQKRVDT
jgi:hypothetical protein